MNKQILMLSVALTACFAAPAFADPDPINDITTVLTSPISTATANTDGTPADIFIDNDGGITVTTGGPAVTINSNNSFDQLAGTTISNKGTTSATGILVDLTTQSWDATNDTTICPAGDCHTTQGIVEAGTIDLSGSGTGKRGIWLEGPATDSGLSTSFTGNIDMTGSTMTITGDDSIGVLIDKGASLNGNITFGTMTMQASSLTATSTGVIAFENNGTVNGDVLVGFVDKANSIDTISDIEALGSTSTTAAGTIGLDIVGNVNGNLIVDTGSSVTAIGTAAQAILITGDINPCDGAVSAGCTSLGAFINRGIIQASGTTATPTSGTGNADGGVAVAIGGSIAGGFYNAGQTSTTDLTSAALISTQGASPALDITPGFQGATPTSLVIGVYTGAAQGVIDNGAMIDAGFSIYNRGSILASSSNFNDSTTAVSIAGDGAGVTTTVTGGLFNSGTITATASSNSSSAPTAAIAISIGSGATIGEDVTGVGDTYTYSAGCDCMVYGGNGTKGIGLSGQDDRAALVNSNLTGNGIISASVSGATTDNSAIAIDIGKGATLPSIINSGTIAAAASSDSTAIGGLNATAILDSSGTLTYVQNNGTITALATPLADGSQSAIAINLSSDLGGDLAAAGVEILNQATPNQSALIAGDILFGQGDHQIVDVEGFTSANVASILGNISFGAGSMPGSDELIVGNFGTVVGTITADAKSGVTVDVRSGGTLTITNDTTALNAAGFTIENGGTLNLTVLSGFTTGIVNATVSPTSFVMLDGGANLNITYGSFVPASSVFTLFTAPKGDLTVISTGTYNDQLKADLPFLFQSAILSLDTSGITTDSYILKVTLKDASLLGLSGNAAKILPFVNAAVANDNPVGAAMVAGITNSQTAQQAYGQFAPEVTGATRAIAMSLTDQATGPVAARQRMLRMYGKDSGDVTLWGQEFAEFLKDPGTTSQGLTGYKDHGFGFVLGIDGGEPKTGWYGGALTFYSGDIVEPLPRDSHTNTIWYMLTGYTDWRGRGLFLDTKVDIGYVDLKEKRYLALTVPSSTGGAPTAFIDEADSHRPGLVASGGFTTGVILAYGSTTLSPEVSVDGMTLREEGYAESHPGTAPGNGDGMDLTVKSYYANSLRMFMGADVREDLDFGDFFLQPDVRLGYRYDFINDPTQLQAQFSNVPVAGVATPGQLFTIDGPDPSQGNFVAGASLSATTDAWTVGANFDFVRGTNGATTEVGTIHLLGRI